MIIALPVKTDSLDAIIAPLFANAKYFIYLSDGELSVEKMEEKGGRSVARSLIAHNINVLITSHIGFYPFVLLKSYGIKVYFTHSEAINVSDLLEQFYANSLTEATSKNFEILFGRDTHQQ